MTMSDRPRYSLVLEAHDGDGLPPAEIRLRALLKTAWRRLGLKCVHLVPWSPRPAEAEKGEDNHA